MKRNTPLDYAEFLLSQSRTRCELHIYANGVKEKLASGYLKPFVAHLRAAEAQVAKGNQVIRLERPLNFLKKNKVTWFTKGTLERFVRFVSTPEVLERVKNIDDELIQLEHVRVALSKTSQQTEDSFYNMDTTSSGVSQTKSSVPMKEKRSSMGMGDSAADGSKIELLRAMDVRLIALKQDQSEAFSRAIAAGFDSSNMADLLDFSEHFGAERLREACIQFVGLYRRRNIAQETAGVEPPSADAASSDSDMSLESCTDVELPGETGELCFVGVEGDLKAVKTIVPDNVGEPNLDIKDQRNMLGGNPSARTRSRWGPPERLQIDHLDHEVPDSEISRKNGEVKHQLRIYSQQDNIRDSDSAFQAIGEFQTTTHLKEQPNRSSLTDCPGPFVSSFGGERLQEKQKGEGNIRGGMFLSRLHKMAQQVDARRSSEDLGVCFTSVERSTDSSGSELSGYGYSSSLYNSAVNPFGNFPLSTVSDTVAVHPHRQDNKLVPGPAGSTSQMLDETLKVGNSVIFSAVDHVAIKDGDKNRKVNLEKSVKLQSATSESSNLKEKQEEPVSTSARRLSVQAAISLFENKKATVGEPPTRKLVRQDSQKAAVQSGNSATEKSVLRRWSGLGNDGADDKQGVTTETDEKGQGKVADAAQKAQIFVEENSLKTNQLPQTETDTSSSQSALRAVPVDSSSLKQMPSAQQQSFVGTLSEAPGEVLPRQFNQELKKNLTRSSSSNLWTNAILPSKPVADTLEPVQVSIRRSSMVAEPVNEDMTTVPVRKEVVDVQVDLEGQPNQDLVPDSLGIMKIPLKRPPTYKELKVDSLSKTGKSRPAESKSPFKYFFEPDKEPSLILHETPVNLYMQALVMIIDNHHQSSLSSGEEESLQEQRGRFYEHYRQLRNARRKGENPAKRAERETKLKSMQEILERRKAEMEAGVSRQTKHSRLVKEQDIAQKGKRSGPPIILQEKETGEDEVLGQQKGLVLASSHEQPLPKTKLPATRKATPKLQKSASASCRVPTTHSASSLRTMPNSQSGTGASVNNQRKMAASSCNGPVHSPVYRNLPVESTRDASNFFSVCTEPTVTYNTEMNGHSQFAKSAVSTVIESDAPFRTAEADFSCQPSDTRKDLSVSSEGGPLYGQVQHSIAGESFQGYVDSYPYTVMDDKLLSVAQNVRLFLGQNHDKLSAQGSGLTKHEVSGHRHSSVSCNDQSCSVFDGFESGTKFVSPGREDIQASDNVEKSLESSILSHAVKYSSLMHPEKSLSFAGKSVTSLQKPLKSSSEKSAGHVIEDASNDESISFANQMYHEKSESNLQSDQMSSQNNENEESSALTSAEKSIELSQSDSICSSSLPQESTTSTYSDAVASPVNFLEENSGTFLGTYSPKLSLSPYSPSSSPVSWTYPKTKYPLEHERHYNVPQSSKEPARGFKRLLHFGRKNRTSEAVSSDGVSVSTASEGDDETEEVREPMRQSSNESFQREGRNVNGDKDYSGFQDQGATHSLRSSIPRPPSNYKLREDHSLGSSSLKASRSFFSLSSFRSRGGEGKSR